MQSEEFFDQTFFFLLKGRNKEKVKWKANQKDKNRMEI